MDWYSDYVASTLKRQDVTGKINFRYKDYRISNSDYKFVADMIMWDEIQIVRSGFKGKKTRKGSYNAKSNVLKVSNSLYKPGVYGGSFTSVKSGIRETSTWVHEATHAIQDINDWRMTVGDAEIMAHLAQAIYLVWISENMLFNDKLRAAGPIARKISDNNKSTNPGKSEVKELKEALRRVPSYNKKWDQMRNLGNDGTRWL